MNNSLKYFSFIIVLCMTLLLNLKNAKAEETTSCKYDDLGLEVVFDEGGTSTITQTKYKESDGAIPVLDWFVGIKSGAIDYVNELKHIETELYGSCPKQIYACTYEKWVAGAVGISFIWEEEHSLLFSNHKKLYLFYSENNMKDNNDLKDIPNNKTITSSELFYDFAVDGYKWGEEWGGVAGGIVGGIGNEIWGIVSNLFVDGGTELLYHVHKSCKYVNYTGDLPTYNLACPNLNIYLGRFNEALNEYKACSKNDASCISKTITNVNEKETLIKNYCKSILKEQDYDGGDEQQCIEACLNNVEETVKVKKAAGLLSDNNNDCGFSQRLGTWIVNIFKWIKYILPVLVIILGILDFIKAIGSDKEDEMKKAQKSFIIRLIAAALVFLVPLILEFVLIKIGFGYDSCSLF